MLPIEIVAPTLNRQLRIGTGPNYTGHAMWGSMPDTGEIGIKIHGAENYDVSGFDLRNFRGSGVDVQDSAGGWQHIGRLHGISAKHCYRGFAFRDSAEYEVVSDCWADNCVFGFLVESGNNAFSNCRARFNSIGVKVAGGTNNAHGVWTGLLSHHNYYNLVCHDVTLGEAFVGCSFIGGQGGADQGVIQMVNAKGISITGGQIAYSNITVDAASQLSLEHVVLRGPVNVTVTAGGVFKSYDPVVMAGAALTLNGAPWNGVA
jgi:hypothetical protein